MRPDKVASGLHSVQFWKPQRMETIQHYTPTQVNESHQNFIYICMDVYKTATKSGTRLFCMGVWTYQGSQTTWHLLPELFQHRYDWCPLHKPKAGLVIQPSHKENLLTVATFILPSMGAWAFSSRGKIWATEELLPQSNSHRVSHNLHSICGIILYASS